MFETQHSLGLGSIGNLESVIAKFDQSRTFAILNKELLSLSA
jgi:hypothetical protein